MGNLRVEAEADLGEILETEFGQTIKFTDPDGNYFEVQGRFDEYPQRENPDTGAGFVIVAIASVSVRASSMARIPKPAENWFIQAQRIPTETAPFESFMMTPDQAPEDATRLGWQTIFLQKAEQTQP